MDVLFLYGLVKCVISQVRYMLSEHAQITLIHVAQSMIALQKNP